MRILMLCQYYPPILGGIGRSVEDLSAELVARGHEVAVVTLWNEQSPEFEVEQGVRVYRIRGTIHRAAHCLFADPRRRYAPPLPDPELVRTLRLIIAHERPQIVHASDWLVHSFLPLKFWSGARLLVTLHDYSLVCSKWTLMYRGTPCSGPALTKCLGCGVSHLGLVKGLPVVVSSWAMGMVQRAAVDMFLPVSRAVAVGNGLVGSDLPFRVVPNFVLDAVVPSHDDSNLLLEELPGEGYLLFVGALIRNKGVDVLLRAYAKLTNAPPLVLVGYETPEHLAELLNLPGNVVVLKNWPHEAVMRAWQRSLIGLVPSIWPEPFGIVVLEAMLAGRPIIATQTGGIPEIVVDGETGLLIPPGDAVALQQAIERLLDDRALLERMGRAGKQRVAEFQAGTVVPRIEQIYQALIDGRESTDGNRE